MSLPYCLGLLSVFLFVPMENFRLYRQVWVAERDQIALDNAVIRWGKGDRETLRFLDSSNRLALALEAAHHVWHACARVPKTRAACLPVDISLERELAGFHREVELALRSRWSMTSSHGLSALPVTPYHWSRPMRMPLKERRCPFCLGKYFWEMNPYDASVALSGNPVLRAGVRLHRHAGSWNYSLTEGTP